MSSTPHALPATPSPARGQAGWLWLALALLSTAAVYWQALGGQLVYDDLALIGENPLIGSLKNLPDLILKPLWDFQNPGSTEQTGYWRPLTSVVYALAWAVDAGAPWAFHAAGLLFHLGATAGAFFLARQLGGSAWLAGGVALLFGLHPVHVESVAWISALNDPLFASLTLLSLASFSSWRKRGSRGIPWCAALGFALALLAKEMALALLPLLVLVDLYGKPQAQPAGVRNWFVLPAERRRAYLPFGLVLLAYLGMRMWVFGSPLAGFDRVITHFGVGAERMALLRLELWGGGLKLLFWPTDLQLFRPFQPNLSFLDARARLALAWSILSLCVVLWSLISQRRSLFFALLFMPISLAPVIYGADSVGLFPCSDRYLYLAVFGSSLFLLCALRSLLAPRFAMGVVLALAAVFGVQSFERSKVWQDELALFGSEAVRDSRSPYVYWGYGRVLLNEYSRTLKVPYLEQAKLAFENSQALLEEAKTPSGADIFASSNDYLQANLGYAHCFIIEESLYSAGSANTSIALLNNLLKSVGKIHQEAELARSQGKLIKGFLPPIELVFAALGAAHFAAGELDLAAENLGRSLRLNPRNIHALKTLAKVDFARDNRAFAILHLRKALEIAPRNGDLQLSLAQILQDSDQGEEAQEIAQRLLQILPNHPGPLWVIADALMQANKPREALIRLREAQKLDEFNGHTWLLIAQAMNAVGTDPEGTIEAFRKAAHYKPGDVTAHYNLAALLYSKAELVESIPYFISAYELAEQPQVLNNLRSVLPDLPFQTPAQPMALSQADWGRKQFDLAEAWLNKALALDPNYAPALMDLGRLLIKRERLQEGLECMQRACEPPTNFSNLIEYATYMGEAGRFEEARKLFAKASAMPLPAEISESNRELVIQRLLQNLETSASEAGAAGSEPGE